jgi:hypothetical protein
MSNTATKKAAEYIQGFLKTKGIKGEVRLENTEWMAKVIMIEGSICVFTNAEEIINFHTREIPVAKTRAEIDRVLAEMPSPNW